MNSDVLHSIDQLPLLQKLFSIGWESGAFSDVTLSVFGQKYNVHRILLCQSPYFERLLRGHWSESEASTLELSFDDPHITPQTFFKALQFLYGQTVSLDEESVPGTLATGCFLGLEPLCERCLEFVADNLSLATFERFYLFCSRYEYGNYSGRMKALCLDFLRMHACWEARDVVKDLEPGDACELLCDDVLWVPTEAERFLMLRDAFGSEKEDMDDGSPMSCHTAVDAEDYFAPCQSSESVAFCIILSRIRFEHFPELSLKHLMNEDISPTVQEAVKYAHRTQVQIRALLEGNFNSLSNKFKRHFLSSSRICPASLNPKDIVNRSFRAGIELNDLANVFKTKGLDSYEYFYAGSLWRIHIVRRRHAQRPESDAYIGIFVHRRPAASSFNSWSDQREVVEASLRVRIGWGSYKVDKTCHGKFEPDSWNSFGWPQFIRTSNFEKCRQPDGALRLVLTITLIL